MVDTLYKEVNYSLAALLSEIELGNLGLPDIQRPFVWKNAKIRDLFDSMYRGYPVGYLLFWQNAVDNSRAIGTDTKQKFPLLMIVDGQQRLTSLYAVVKGIEIIRKTFHKEKITIAFNPIEEKFAVADAAIRRDKEYLPDISILWKPDVDSHDIVEAYLENLEASRELDKETKRSIRKAVSKVQNLTSYPMTALELSATVSEEEVSEVFVRINSKGQPLKQSDFILTLMSVFWDEGRRQLEDFCRDAQTPSRDKSSPYNVLIQPEPDQLLRVAVGLAFKRARLQYVYAILRGKDLETGKIDDERRVAQFDRLKTFQEKVLNLQHWHDFLKCIRMAGYLNDKMITSKSHLLYSYIFYLIGRIEYAIEIPVLRKAIARWFFMINLTGRYTSSPESALEFDMAQLRSVKTGEEFLQMLEKVCHEKLTNDFWSMTLPSELATSSPRSPSLFAYQAALVLLEAKVLFSDMKMVDLLNPHETPPRNIEKHHLFPKAYLKRQGITEQREMNQTANYAFLEWNDNAKIRDQGPAHYLPIMKAQISPQVLERMYEWHALPDQWEEMPYKEFLILRRERMAKIIQMGYQTLADHHLVPAFEMPSPEALVEMGETTDVEYKSTLRVNLHTDNPDPKMELACLKTLAGFINANGGTLLIGVADNGDPVGIERDKFPNEDKMNLHLINLITARMGADTMMYIHPQFDDYQEVRVFIVKCLKGRSPVFVKDGEQARFFLRTGAATNELTGTQMQNYIKHRFG